MSKNKVSKERSRISKLKIASSKKSPSKRSMVLSRATLSCSVLNKKMKLNVGMRTLNLKTLLIWNVTVTEEIKK